MSTLSQNEVDRSLRPPALAGDHSAAWWVQLGHAVDELARRYPRTYGASIPATWRDDAETVELLACITCWRQELDEPDHEQAIEREIELMPFPTSGLERARQEWEWHAHRDQWLARLAETGRSPLCAGHLENAG